MKQYYLKIQSKNEKSLKIFVHFFFKHFKTKFIIIEKFSQIQNKRKIITLLKSPHVNKTAQDQFESHNFAKKIRIDGCFLKKLVIFLKNLLIELFQDVSISLKFIINKKKNSLFLFSFNNIKFFKKKFLKNNYTRLKQKAFSKNFAKKNLLFYLPKFLIRISVFGETSVIFYE